MKKTNKDQIYAFLVHPRDVSDLHKKFPILRFVPNLILLFLSKHAPPVVVATIKGGETINGVTCKGYIISITLTGEKMLSNRTLARNHVLRAIKKAKQLGATHVGLGAFTSVVTEGGANVADLVPDMYVTNGNALTAAMTYRDVQSLLNRNKKNIVTVVGATGSIGSVLTELLVGSENISRVYAVGRTPLRMESLVKRITSVIGGKAKIFNKTLHDALPESDIVIITTSAKSAVIETHLLKNDSIVYDITQPKNLPFDLLRKRKDVTVYEGGLVCLPKRFQINYDIGVPKGMTYACMAETILISMTQYPDNFCIGTVTLDKVKYAESLAGKHSFSAYSRVL